MLRVLDGGDGHDLGEAIPDTRACSVAWEPDGSGFAYTRYPEGDEYHRTVHHHTLGADWRDDPVVWAEHPNPQAWPDVTMAPDGRWLLVHVMVGWARRRRPRPRPHDTVTWRTLIEGVEATSELDFAIDGRSLVGVTTVDAPRGRVVRVPLDGDGDWETIVAEGDAVLSQAGGRGGRPARRGHDPRRGHRPALRPRRASARHSRRHRRGGRRRRPDRRPHDRRRLRRRRFVRRPDVVVADRRPRRAVDRGRGPTTPCRRCR